MKRIPYSRFFITVFLVGAAIIAHVSGVSADDAQSDDYYRQGMRLYDAGKYAEAEAMFAKALQSADTTRQKYYEEGLRLYEQGDFKNAQEQFQKALSVSEQGVSSEKSATVSAGQSDRPGNAVEYVIGNGDVLEVKVWQNQDLDGDVIVRPDGMISFPLVGDMRTSGLTIRQFREALMAALKDYIRFPQVSVSIKSIGGRRVIVLGEVRNPGIYAVTGEKTVLEAVGLAGGFTEHAVSSSIMLVRGGPEKPVPRRLNLARVLKRADIRDNLEIEPGDIVYVPRKFIKDVNYVLKMILDPTADAFYVRDQIRD